MLGLVLDTSTERGIVAVVKNDGCLFEKQLPFGLQNSHYLLPELEQELRLHHLTTADLDYVACGAGPGSYTGIRVGATVAKAIAFVHQLPLVGVSTMDAFVSDIPGRFAVVIDAKMGGVYLQQCEMTEEGRVVRGEMMVRPLDEASSLLRGIPLILTPNAKVIRQKIETLSQDQVYQWQEMYPSALNLARASLEKMNRGEFLPNGFENSALELHYLRKTQAEIERESGRRS